MSDQKKNIPFLLEHNRPECIGCGACAAVAPEFWEMNDDGKADIIDCRMREDDGWEEKDLEKKDFDQNLEAAQSCPVNVIHIYDLLDDVQLI